MTAYPNVNRSMDAYARAGTLIPGWTQLISRRADQFANGVSPVYAQQAKGSRFIDIDENEYIDWVNAVGAIILGHADDVVDGAVVEQIKRGSIYTNVHKLVRVFSCSLCRYQGNTQYQKGS